jgi:CheY-like chemotaxis protein
MKHIETILIIESNPREVVSIQRGFGELKHPYSLAIGTNGQEGIDYLTGQDRYANRTRHPLPQLIITALNMPITNGFDFLKWLKAHPEFSVIPTIVFTSSREPQDVRDAYCCGADAYVNKPSSQKELVEILRDLLAFWRHVIKPELSPDTACETSRMCAPAHGATC